VVVVRVRVTKERRLRVESLNGSVASSQDFPRCEGFGLDGEDEVDET